MKLVALSMLSLFLLFYGGAAPTTDDAKILDLHSFFTLPPAFSFLFRQMISDVLRCSSANLPGFDDVTSSDLSFIKNLTEYNNVHNTDPISRDN